MGELNSVAALWAARQELPKGGNGHKVSLWRVISGMEAGKEDELSPGERAAGLKKLVNVFARVLKNEFKEYREAREREAAARAGENKEASPASDADRNVCATDGGGAEALEELPRNVLWDPVATVCSYLNVAERALSKFGREVCGYSAQQMADRLRVRELKPKLRAELEEFVRREKVEFHAWEERTTRKEEAQWWLYKKWQAYKRASLTETNEIRAVRFGFKYYARYRMACLLEFGVTPETLEFEAFEDLAAYYAAREGLSKRVDAILNPHGCPYWPMAQKPYRDLWAKFWKERREWLLEMKAKWGLDEGLSEYEGQTGDEVEPCA